MLQAVERGIKMLDLMYPYETHKLGVVYVGPGQVSQLVAICHQYSLETRWLAASAVKAA